MYGSRGISKILQNAGQVQNNKKFRTAEVNLTFRRSVYARHFAKSAFDEMEIYFSLNIHPSCYFN